MPCGLGRCGERQGASSLIGHAPEVGAGKETTAIRSKDPPSSWSKPLAESSVQELELLLRAVVYHSSEPILIADDSRDCIDASFGAGRLLRLSRDEIVGRKLDDFVAPDLRPRMAPLWRALLEQGAQEGTLPLAVSGGGATEGGYMARAGVLPERHIAVLSEGKRGKASGTAPEPVPSWSKDYALYVLDPEGVVATWYAGAERMYGCKRAEVIGESPDFLHWTGEEGTRDILREELQRAAAAGRFGSYGHRLRQDGSPFWAHVLTAAVSDEAGRLRGFARLVRDFGDRRHVETETRAKAAPKAPRSPGRGPGVVGIVSGEFDRVTDASEAFLAMVGYEHDNLVAGKPYWPDLTAPESRLADERAHEEALVDGACTPFEKEYIRRDGSRARVLETKAVLTLTPFRWTLFVQDLTTRSESAELADGSESPQDFEGIVGVSASLRRLIDQVEIVAPTDATVLILGETGTGKELLARAIHRRSARRDHPFVTLNCAAIPSGLLESELFGHEKGAFTGALARKVGRFELANQGTLFLDEVGDIPLDLQPKLLRALQEKEFERLGGVRTIPINVRLLAATNRHLGQMMGDKLFRSDLYYRLNVFPIVAAPLRDRPEDIPVLARHFLRKYATEMKRDVETIPEATLRSMMSWSWPGNVRELENFIERSVILSPGKELRAPLADVRAEAVQASTRGTLEQVEKEHILRVLRETDGVISKAARKLGMPRTTLNATLRKLGISRKDF